MSSLTCGRLVFHSLLALTTLAGWLAACGMGRAVADDDQARRRDIEALVERLGSQQYREREAAAAALAAAGPDAIDPLLAAAEQSDDLEIAMRARWLVDVLPLVSREDPAEVSSLLAAYRTQSVSDRLKTMHRLLRLDEDIGIEPLARLVRVERSPEAARVAAALLAREYRAGDPFFPGVARRILRGLGGSTRPVAVFLRGVAAAAVEADPDGDPLAAATAALERLGQGRSEPAGESDPAEDGAAGSPIAATTQRIFQRAHVEVLLASGQREEALARTRSMLEAALALSDDEAIGSEMVAVLSWAADRGTPEVIHWLLDTHGDRVGANLLAAYAAATALAACDEIPRAESTAASASRLQPDDTNEHLQAAMSLARWGRVEWARREYEAILADGRAPPLVFGLTSILYSEYLHDLALDREAAACLRRLLEETREGRPSGEDILRQLDRDPRSSRSRMLFFESCAAAVGDAAATRRLVEQSLEALPTDVDALIALYKLPAATPDERTETVRRIAEAAERIEDEIEADSNDANARNEYAWLVANTEGDAARAVRYSKESLDISFDNSSYLDTLAHCQAAIGRLDLAVRTQSLALRHEPHGRTIRRNLERFLRLEAERSAEAGPTP
jgi:tetratricopeptide (TPR) repeat protein